MAVIGLKRFDAAVSGQCRNLQSSRLLFSPAMLCQTMRSITSYLHSFDRLNKIKSQEALSELKLDIYVIGCRLYCSQFVRIGALQLHAGHD